MKRANKSKIRKSSLRKRSSPEKNTSSEKDPKDVHQPNTLESVNSWPTDVGSSVWFVLALVPYLWTLHPSVPGGDAGELIVAAHESGVAHPPGYPLFTAIAHVAILALQNYGSVAWRVNLATALTAALASTLLFASIRKMTGHLSPAVLGAGLFTWSRLTWEWSVTGEVFALNNLLISAVLLLLVMLHKDAQTPGQRARVTAGGGFLCGFCLSNQHTAGVYVAVLGLWVMAYLHHRKELGWRKMVGLPVAFLSGLLPYTFLYLRSLGMSGRWTWGDQTTWAGFLKHVLRQEYGTFDLLQGHSGQGMLHGMRIYVEHVCKDLTPVCLLLLGLCLPLPLALSRRNGKGQLQVVSVCLAMLLLYLGLFTWRANLDTSNPLFLGVVERFWLQSDLVIAFLAAVAYSSVFVMLDRAFPLMKWRLDCLGAVVLVAFQLQRNYQACDQSRNLVVRDFAEQVLRSMPQGAIVLTKGDLPSNSIRYLHLCEDVRPDIILLDQEVLTLEWSVPMYRRVSPNITFPGDVLQPFNGVMPDGRAAFNFKAFLDANFEKRPMFGCIGVQDHEPSWQESYELWPFGVCHQFIQKGTELHLEEWVARTRAAQYNWSYPLHGYDQRSWEKVATEEMWSSRTAAALSLLEKSEMFPAGREKKAMLTYSYQLYKEAMAAGQGYPVYWHKNLALVCERLSRADGSEYDAALLQESAEHFSLFLKMDPGDSDADKIRDAIKSLNEFVAKARKVHSS